MSHSHTHPHHVDRGTTTDRETFRLDGTQSRTDGTHDPLPPLFVRVSRHPSSGKRGPETDPPSLTQDGTPEVKAPELPTPTELLRTFHYYSTTVSSRGGVGFSYPLTHYSQRVTVSPGSESPYWFR